MVTWPFYWYKQRLYAAYYPGNDANIFLAFTHHNALYNQTFKSNEKAGINDMLILALSCEIHAYILEQNEY